MDYCNHRLTREHFLSKLSFSINSLYNYQSIHFQNKHKIVLSNDFLILIT